MIAPCDVQAPRDVMRVLVADDEPSIRMVYNALFRTMGGVETAPNAAPADGANGAVPSLEFTLCAQGDEAFEAARTAMREGRPYGLAFLDVRMPPGPDGLVTAERIRDLDDRICFAMVTGFSDYTVEEIVRRVPPRDRLIYLQKPFHIQEIRQIASAMGKRWLTDHGTAETPDWQFQTGYTVPVQSTLGKRDLTADGIDAIILGVQHSAAARAGDSSAVAADIATRLSELSGVDRVRVWKLSADATRMDGLSALPVDEPDSSVPLGARHGYLLGLDGCRSKTMQGGDARALWDLAQQHPFSERTETTLHVPVRVQGAVRAVVICESNTAGRLWTTEERNLAIALGDCLGQAMAQARDEGPRAAVLAKDEEFSGLFENTIDMLFVHRLDGEFISINPGCQRVTGYTREEILGGKVQDYIAPEYRAYAAEIAARKLTGKDAPQVYELELIAKDGSRVPVEVNSWPVCRDGRSVALQGIARDISDRRRAGEMQHTLRKQLLQSQRLESIGRLAGGVAHDFNNLLTAILGSGEMLLIGLGEDHPSKGRVEEILTAGQRAATLTRQLLAFSRRQVMQPRRLAINSIVTEMDALLRRIIGEDIELRTRLEEGLSPIKADPGQLEQVVINLAVNARDAMPSGGKLTIATAQVELEQSGLSADFSIRPGRYVRLTVEDNGTGMAPEIQAHVFEPFFSTKTQDGKGTGLGLATVYGIVKQSGGYIWFDSEPGAGTAFHLFFPVAEDGPVSESSLNYSSRIGDVPKGSETILLVEDDEVLRSLIGKVLSGHGYRVVEAANGAEALQRSRDYEESIDLVLTDVVMPLMGGRDLACQLCKERPGIIVLLMSGYSDQDTVHQCMKETGGSFLQKPFTPGTLVKKLRRILDSRAKY